MTCLGLRGGLDSLGPAGRLVRLPEHLISLFSRLQPCTGVAERGGLLALRLNSMRLDPATDTDLLSVDLGTEEAFSMLIR